MAVHVLGMAIFMIFRTILYFVNIEHVDGVENKGFLFFRAFLKGLRFDNAIVFYISSIPLVVLCISVLFNKISRELILGCSIYYILLQCGFLNLRFKYSLFTDLRHDRFPTQFEKCGNTVQNRRC